MIDTHCHIHDTSVYDFAFSRQQGPKKVLNRADLTPEKLVSRAAENGVTQMICVGTTHEDSMTAKGLAEKFPGTVFWSYGIHPDECNQGRLVFGGFGGCCRSRSGSVSDELAAEPREDGREERASKNNVCLVAIGEVGLDYKDGTEKRVEQIQLFEQMLQLAKDNNLPCIFHVREAFDDFFAVVDNFSEIRGAVHSFSDSPENLKKSLEHDFYVGVNGLATFTTLPTPPLEKLLLETDAPFLTPVPFRGKINEPVHILDVANWVSNKLGVSLDIVSEKTTNNARQLFGIRNSVVLSPRAPHDKRTNL